MKILELLISIFEKLKGMWGSLSDEQKKAIAEAIANAFKAILRAFYQEYTKSKNDQKDSNQEKANA